MREKKKKEKDDGDSINCNAFSYHKTVIFSHDERMLRKIEHEEQFRAKSKDE